MDSYPISEAQIDNFQQDGHIVLSNVCSPDEIVYFRDIICDAVQRKNPQTLTLDQRDTYGKAFHQTTNLQEDDEIVRCFVFAKRFARIAGLLMGVNAVRLYHDQALFKEPGGGHTPWHQDAYYWPLYTINTITMWMPLVDVSKEMGTMHFASGSHHDGFAGHLEISDASETAFQKLIDQNHYPISNCGDMKAGDASFHSGLVLHGAPPNFSWQTREAMTVIYYEDGTRLMTPNNPNRAGAKIMIGKNPGDLADSDSNPILWRKND